MFLTFIQLKSVGPVRDFPLITPIKQAFEEVFVLVRNAVAEILPMLDTMRLTM